MSGVGSIVFGPRQSLADVRDWASILQGVGAKADFSVHACNCIGPQPGENKCPCALRGESEQGRKMVQDGVTINGRRYKLVPEDAA